MSNDAAFREALDMCLEMHANYGSVSVPALTAARARVLALYAEAQQQGERDQLALAEQVAEATMRMEQGRAERQGDEGMVVMNKYGDLYVNVTPQHFENGDKVRVTKVEEGQ